MRVVQVPLGGRSYSISIGSNQLGRIGKKCLQLGLRGRGAIISDENVAPHFAQRVITTLKMAGFDPALITIPSGEKSKNLRTVQDCYSRLAAQRFERKSFIIALGGGVVGDVAGFIAATYLRGIPFIQIPTTLLAQVDSSVGGKVGVNLPAGKNLVGAFYQPRWVLCDLETLRTLPEREFRAGLAEVFKYGIIYDRRLFAQLERDLPKILQRDPKILSTVIARCCEIKAEVVAEDETESGRRAILNFGHTIGHALEAISGYGKYLHGEAISIGQVAAARISTLETGLPVAEAVRIEKLFQRAGLPTRIDLSSALKTKLWRAMQVDKKVSRGEIKFVLAHKIGKVSWGKKVSSEVIDRSLWPD